MGVIQETFSYKNKSKSKCDILKACDQCAPGLQTHLQILLKTIQAQVKYHSELFKTIQAQKEFICFPLMMNDQWYLY